MMKKRSMYFRMISASLLRRRSRMVIALLAVAIGATILSGLVTIYVEVPRQLGTEFRNYGANMIVTASSDEFTLEEAATATSLIDAADLVGAAPYRYETVRMHEQPIVAAGTDIDQVKLTSPYWSVEGAWPEGSHEIMIGDTVSEDLGLKVGDEVTVSFSLESEIDIDTGIEDALEDVDEEAEAEAETEAEAEVEAQTLEETDSSAESQDLTDTVEIDFTVSGILNTGGSEEDYVYLSLDDLAELAGESDAIDLLELSVQASSSGLSAYKDAINEALQSATASLVKRVTASETTVLGKLQALILLVTVVVLALTMICVATTMSAVVSERRKEVGLRKAIGATDQEIINEFMGEGMLLGAAGGLLGSVLGFGFALMVSISIFSSTITPRWILLPVTIVVSVGVTGIACLLPIKSATAIEPALVLKGE